MKTLQDGMHALAVIAFLDRFRHFVQFVQMQEMARIELVGAGNQRVIAADRDTGGHCRPGQPGHGPRRLRQQHLLRVFRRETAQQLRFRQILAVRTPVLVADELQKRA